MKIIYLISVFVAFSNADDPFCDQILLNPSDSQPNEFLVSTVSRSWRQANNYCMDWGGMLASISDQNEEVLF